MHTWVPSVARHLWVARANPGPRTYVCTSRPSPTRPTLYSARLERTVTPTSCKLSHLGTCNTPLPLQLPSGSPLPPLRFAVASFALHKRIFFDPPLLHPFPRSSPIVRRAFFAYPFGAYVTEQIGDGESYVGPYLRLSRPMYRDRGETCGCSCSRRFLPNGSEGRLFAKLIPEQRREQRISRLLHFWWCCVRYAEGLVRCGRSNALLEIH